MNSCMAICTVCTVARAHQAILRVIRQAMPEEERVQPRRLGTSSLNRDAAEERVSRTHTLTRASSENVLRGERMSSQSSQSYCFIPHTSERSPPYMCIQKNSDVHAERILLTHLRYRITSYFLVYRLTVDIGTWDTSSSSKLSGGWNSS